MTIDSAKMVSPVMSTIAAIRRPRPGPAAVLTKIAPATWSACTVAAAVPPLALAPRWTVRPGLRVSGRLITVPARAASAGSTHEVAARVTCAFPDRVLSWGRAAPFWSPSKRATASDSPDADTGEPARQQAAPSVVRPVLKTTPVPAGSARLCRPHVPAWMIWQATSVKSARVAFADDGPAFARARTTLAPGGTASNCGMIRRPHNAGRGSHASVVAVGRYTTLSRAPPAKSTSGRVRIAHRPSVSQVPHVWMAPASSRCRSRFTRRGAAKPAARILTRRASLDTIRSLSAACFDAGARDCRSNMGSAPSNTFLGKHHFGASPLRGSQLQHT